MFFTFATIKLNKFLKNRIYKLINFFNTIINFFNIVIMIEIKTFYRNTPLMVRSVPYSILNRHCIFFVLSILRLRINFKKFKNKKELWMNFSII